MSSVYSVRRLLTGDFVGEKVTVRGWVRTRRDSKGGFSFLELNDGSSLKNIQAVVDAGLDNWESEVSKLSTGCSVTVTGELLNTPGREQSVEIRASEVEIHGWAAGADYPLQKKRHSFEFLRQIAHLRPRTNTFGAVARIRNAASMAVHRFFQEREFTYIHTPIITGSDCEGAGETFLVTGRKPSEIAAHPGFEDDFFGKPAYLTVSGQLEAEIYALALGKVYTFGPTFRAENSNTARHLAEFWMIEPEMSFCDLHCNMELAEEFLRSVFRSVLETCADDMEFFNKFIDATAIETVAHVAETPFERISYTEAVEMLKKSGQSFEFPVEWGTNLQAEHERYITEQVVKKPVIISDYPLSIKPFYMRVNEDGRTVAAMDVLVPRIGEIIGGSQREERYDVLLERMRGTGLDPDDYWWYLDLRKYGTVPHSGFGLGFERLIQFVTGMANIRDVIPFPRTPKNLEF